MAQANETSKEFAVVALVSTSHAMKLERILGKRIKVEIIPTPTEIHRSCGLSFRLAMEELPQAQGILATAGVPYAIYALSYEKLHGRRQIRLLEEKGQGHDLS